MTRDYKRNGTTDLFAAMNVSTGEALYDTRKRHAGTDVLTFFKLIDLHVARDLEIHVVLDNLSAHKSQPAFTLSVFSTMGPHAGSEPAITTMLGCSHWRRKGMPQTKAAADPRSGTPPDCLPSAGATLGGCAPFDGSLA